MARVLVLTTSAFLAVACATGGAPPPNSGTGPAGTPAPDPTAQTQTPQGPQGPGIGRRAQSAVEGMLVGAVVGGQAGPIGAAIGAGAALLYGAITGKVPFGGPMGGGGVSGGPPGGRGAENEREAELEQQIELEMARQDALESQIQDELRRQEELLRQLDREDAQRAASVAATGPGDEDLSEQADPRAAPAAPRDRDVPLIVFEEDTVEVKKGAWENERKLEVTRRTLDADEDGSPEEVRYFDNQSGLIVRKEVDRDYDGSIDSWTRYESGSVSARELDENGDGRPDVWESYAGGRMTSRE
ncbi:MAG: hypothetical protein ABFS46_05695, partial [Myxococcota bacterium]